MTEIIIAIMFYLQLLLPGESYTYDQLEDIYMSNQQAITTVQNDDTQLESAINFYSESDTQLHGEWEIDEKPILDPPPPGE